MRIVVVSLLKIAAVALLGGSKCATGTEIKFKGDEQLSHVVSPLPYSYLMKESLPRNFFWGNVDGKSYLTRMLNQHIPYVFCCCSLCVHLTRPVLHAYVTFFVPNRCDDGCHVTPLFNSLQTILWKLLGA
jgi:hypothetical protein